jgi:predicted nuclease of predicted toxin-antitoxin system
MTIWIDAQLPPQLASWLNSAFGLQARPVRDLGLREAEDEPIFMAARQEGVVVMTKDSDFELLLSRFGPPPQVIWITCGNTSNHRLREILTGSLPDALRLLEAGEPIVEITG